ncbi:MAG: RDD family protein [Candidatus Sifarchaeia archaeon]|jgi:DNA-binding HxlR family transcriptional regulator
MSVTDENVSRILSVLAHPLRRQVILYLNEENQGSFTDLANFTGVDTGKLSFHLRTLGDFLEQTPESKYKLSTKGKNAIVLIKDLEEWALGADVTDKSTGAAKPSKRVGASLIDFVLIQAFMLLAFQLYLLNLNLLVFVGLFWLYLTLFEGFAGQSIGKLLLRIKVVRIDGENISYDQAAIRNFGKTFLLPFDLFFGLRLKDKRYLRFFEKFTQTTVIDVPRKAISAKS